MRQAHSNNIPKAIEYLGMGEWAVRWDVQIDTTREVEEGIIPYVYQEEVFKEKPDYDLFVTSYIRSYYSLDQESALKSNMLAALLAPEDEKSKVILLEWDEFEKCRNTAKAYGREVFNTSNDNKVNG